MSGLTELLARVEGCEGPDRDIDRDLYLQLECELIPAHGIVTDWVALSHRWMPGDKGRFYHRGGVPTDGTIGPEFTASIDAALALVERMLPERHRIQLFGREEGWGCRLTTFPGYNTVSSYEHYDDEQNPLRYQPTACAAILVALLKTLIARTPATGEDPTA